jgi:hypothetical protein
MKQTVQFYQSLLDNLSDGVYLVKYQMVRLNTWRRTVNVYRDSGRRFRHPFLASLP